jgi:hypothetical protein
MKETSRSIIKSVIDLKAFSHGDKDATEEICKALRGSFGCLDIDGCKKWNFKSSGEK